MHSVKAALERAGPLEFKVGMSSDQVKYGYIVCERIARKFLNTPVLGHEDLVQIGMEAIVRELTEHPHLWEYNAWMGKVAQWEMNNALAKLLGRRGLTRTGKARQVKIQPVTMSEEYEPSYTPELADNLITQEMVDILTAKQKEVVEDLVRGFTQSEIARKLGITPASVMNRRQAAKHKLEVLRGDYTLESTNPY